MAINFPDSPANNDSFTSGGKKWIFNGTTWNLITANSYTISTGEVTTANIAAGAVTTANIAAGAVTAAKLGNDISLTPADGSITAAKIASDAVTEAKIGSGAVTQAKLTSGLSGITVTTTSLRSSVIPSPFTGQFAFMTDTNAFIRWDGSAWVTAIVTAPTEAPTGLTLDSATLTTATISFAAGATGGSAITNYQYALSTNGGSSYGFYSALNPADGTSPITITGLTGGTAYYIKLKAVNAQGVSNAESNALSFSTASISVEYLVIAGGGAGGVQVGGGGGAGGYRTNVVGAVSGRGSAAEASMTLVNGTYAVTVGAGGVGGFQYGYGGTHAGAIGNSSVFNGITSLYGGGGSGHSSQTGTNGGSGGGADGNGGTNFGAGTTAQGYAGGTGTAGAWAGGGGGGAGGVGGNAGANTGGAGGAGQTNSINGTATLRAGGGGGGQTNGTGGAGGSGGGGTGGSNDVAPLSGTPNTGGGGGGTRDNTPNGSGGSGVVIIRYLTAGAAGATITVGAGLTSTTTTSGSYTVRTFTAGSGNLVIS